MCDLFDKFYRKPNAYIFLYTVCSVALLDNYAKTELYDGILSVEIFLIIFISREVGIVSIFFLS